MGNEFIKNIKYFLNCFLDIIFSSGSYCIICRNYIDNKELICNFCENTIKKYHDFFYIISDQYKIKAYSANYYSGIIKELVMRLKYKSDFNAGKVLAKYMLSTIISNSIDFDLITYVPITQKAKNKRGYNQSKYLAKIIGYKTDKKVMNILKKYKNTKDQIGLDKEERWDNIKDCFKVINNNNVKQKRILLIDDVITTGATGFHCAKEMLDKGALEVIILTAAKSKI